MTPKKKRKKKPMKAIRDYLAEIGAKGGAASKRVLTPEQARAMAAARKSHKGGRPRKTYESAN